MTEEMNRSFRPLPEGVVQEDQRLESAAESASEALAYHRWHWTLDESNEQRVSFGVYAKHVGRHKSLIHRYAHAYVLLTRSVDPISTVSEAYYRASISAEKEAVIEAVAAANNQSFTATTVRHKEEVKEVRNAVLNEAERREEQGKDFAAEERADYAKKLAEMKARSRAAEKRHREEAKKAHTRMFLDVDATLSKARLAIKEAIENQAGVEFDDEEVELLAREYDVIESAARIGRSKLTGDSGTDWDAELAKLEEYRQYG